MPTPVPAAPAATPAATSALANIQHVIVLMFENRSFDHILGDMPGVNGVTPDLYNTYFPLAPASAANPATNLTAIVPTLAPTNPGNLPTESACVGHDFNHDFGDGMLQDIFGPGTTGFIGGSPQGNPPVTYPAANSGFLSTLLGPGQTPAGPNGPGALSYFQWGSMQVFHTLAKNFVVCDAWHCDMPGHTSPNRAFMHCATTGDLGINDNDAAGSQNMVNRLSIFERIQNHGQTWKMYWPGANCDTNWLNQQVFSQAYDSTNPSQANVTEVPMAQFFADLSGGTLPFYSFIMCWNDLGVGDTSMHPASAVEAGEELLGCIYTALQESPYWQNTLLVVNFDENGGIYDHHSAGPSVLPVTVPPDFDPNDGQAPAVTTWTSATTGKTYSFDFTALGVRIPVMLISPWLKAGVCSTPYQNTSILRFLQDLLPNTTGQPYYLTQRDRAAPSFAPEFDYTRFGVATARTDCPTTLPNYGLGVCAALQSDTAATAEQLAAPPTPHMVELTRQYLAPLPGHPDSGRPVTRPFATVGEMRAYAQERREAARRWIGKRR